MTSPHGHICECSCAEQKQERIEQLENTFRHYHKCNMKNDACAECGLDLRDSVHIRWAKTSSMQGASDD